MKIGSIVRITKDTITPGNVGREGEIVDVRRKEPRPYQVRIMYGPLPIVLNYSAAELTERSRPSKASS